MGDETYAFRVGELRCLAINDGTYSLPADLLFSTAPEEELEEALRSHGLGAEEVSLDETCLLVKSGKETILIDTGMGPGPRATTGKLVRNLKAEGVHPGEVTTVILTHSHGDHIGGLTNSNGELAFPSARFVMAREEWDFCMAEETRAEMELERVQFWDAKLGAIRSRVELIADKREIAPGVSAVMASGHMPGHMMVEVSSAGHRMLYISDTVLHQLHLEHPEWCAVFDRDPHLAIHVRHDLLCKAEAEDSLVLAFHLPFPGLGYVRKERKAWRWEPVAP